MLLLWVMIKYSFVILSCKLIIVLWCNGVIVSAALYYIKNGCYDEHVTGIIGVCSVIFNVINAGILLSNI